MKHIFGWEAIRASEWTTVLAALACGFGLCIAPQPAWAANGTWTATGAGSVGYWTNNANWNGATYPGADGANQNAYLTNSTGAAYTSILDTTLTNIISTLVISNRTGQAWLIVTNAVLTNTTFSMNTGGRLQIDYGGSVTGITSFTWNGVNGVMNINSGSLCQTSGDMTIGDTAGSEGNRLTVNGGTVRAAGWIRVGRSGNANTMIVSNATVSSGGLDIGWRTYDSSSSSNTVIVGTGTVWNVGGGRINVGAESRYPSQPAAYTTNNVLIVDGGVITNGGDMSIYRFYSRLTITNGGKVFAGALAQGTTGNVVTVTGPGSYWKLTGFTLGYGGDGRASNALWVADGAVVANSGSSSFKGGQVRITGTGSIYGGSPSVSGTNNSVLVDAGGQITGGGITIGAGSSNTVTIAGPGSKYLGGTAGFTVGNAAGDSYNSLTISNGAIFSSGLGGAIAVGNASGANYNSVNIGGAGNFSSVTGQYNDVVGGSGGAFNTLTVTNALFYRSGNTWGMTIGNASPSNTILIAAGGIWNAGAGIDSITVGSGAATGNLLQVTAGGVVSNLLRLYVGNGATASGNRAIIDGGSVFANSGPGYASPGVWVMNGTDNQIIVRNGGLLEVGLDGNNNPETLSVAAGTGNLITNSGGIYQFRSVAPTITTNGNPDGSIFLNGGTISYRGIASGLSLTANWSSDLKKMTWLGDNALRLNGSTASSPTGGYTFDTGISPTNYSRLELVNGTTAVTGQRVTIGSGGSVLFSNTVATISGAFTNSGAMTVVDSRVTCSTNLVLQGGSILWATNAASSNLISVAGTLTTSGSIAVNATGAVAGKPAQLILIRASGAIANNASWTVTPSTYSVKKQDQDLILKFFAQGTVILLR